MSISYKKLWILLAERSLSKVDLRKMAGITPGILTKLNKNEVVSFTMLLKICEALKCDIGDIVEVIHTENSELKILHRECTLILSDIWIKKCLW